MRYVPFFEPAPPSRAVRDNLFVLPALGIVLVAAFGLSWGDLETRLAYETDSLTVRGSVVGVVQGEPTVEFVPVGENEPVVTEARGSYERGAPRDVEVSYLVDDPTEAAVAGGMWVPWVVPLLALLPLTAALIPLYPNGPRAVLDRTRRKTEREGPALEGERAERAVRWRSRTGVVLLVVSALLLTSAAAVWNLLGTPRWPVVLGVLGGLPLLPGMNMLYRSALCRAMSDRGETRPSPPWTLPFGWYTGLTVAALGAGAVLLVVALTPGLTPRDAETGRALVVSTGCTSAYGWHGCAKGATVEYRVDGLTYRQWVHRRGNDFEGDETVDVVWSERDPAVVRLVP